MKLKLHNQILIGFILGALFGIIFNSDPNSLVISSGEQTKTIKNPEHVDFILPATQPGITAGKDSVIKSFNNNSQPSVIKYFEGLKKKEIKGLRLRIKSPPQNEEIIDNVTDIRREFSLGLAIKPVGEIFIRLLNMIAVPLVLSSLIVGAASLAGLSNVLRIGAKTIGFYGLTALITIILGGTIANLVKPGIMMDVSTRDRLISAYQLDAKADNTQNISTDIGSFITNIVPSNPFKALAEGDYLQIVFIAILAGLILCKIPEDKSTHVIKFFDGIMRVCLTAVEKVMFIAPLAVFALISATAAEFGYNIFYTLSWYVLTALSGLAILGFIIYPILLKLFTRYDLRKFFRDVRQVIAVAFTTSSSSATLPVTLDVTEKKLGVPNKIASFVLPLGTTINKDGTTLYQIIAALFIAQVYGISLSFPQLVSLLITSAIVGAATAPVAGAGLIMLSVILSASGLPLEGIALIIGVDRIINMSRSVVNVLCDPIACLVVNKGSEKD